ncbi:hypothetical protein J1N35_033031 [Gossypium stocksii]|uniref:Transcription factor WD40-like family n=1 Tax=Gossypium stocksii TaxID=47602 RepID=A0A9D3ZMZ5_9ROSI|nr:hypothetical protein J1N35_033031 [Gossypium stocksii]
MKNNMHESTFIRQQFPVLYSPSRVLAILVHWWLPEENEGNAGVASMIVISTALQWEPFVLEPPLETVSFSAQLLNWHCWHFRNAVSTPIIVAELLLQSLQYQVQLHLYMHDYFIKNNMHETAASLRKEAGVPNNSVQIDHPQGILKEWWSISSDIVLKEYSEAETSAQMSKQMMQTEEHQNTDDMLQQQQDSVGNTSTPVRNLSPSLSGESENKAFFFGEGRSLNYSTEEISCCDFSSDGKLLAIAGREEKVVLFSSQDFIYCISLKLISVFFLQVMFWNTEDHSKFVTNESHSLPISDIRFKPNSTIVATSSYDKTVRIWDSAEAGKSPLKLQGHGDHVLSLDFHPRRMNLLCSSDRNNEIRFWDINQGSWTHIFKGATKQVRFEPRNGKLLATSSGNVVKVFDVQTYKLYAFFKGHDKEVQSICWDPDGTRIISISEDSARIWSVSEQKSLHELSSTGNYFQCCTFHPWNWKIWIIGGYRHLTITPPKPEDPYNNGGQYFITNCYQIFKNYLRQKPLLRLHKMLVLDIDIFLLPQIFIPVPLSNHLLKLIKCAPHILLHLVQAFCNHRQIMLSIKNLTIPTNPSTLHEAHNCELLITGPSEMQEQSRGMGEPLL